MPRRLVLVSGPPGSGHDRYAQVLGQFGFRTPRQRVEKAGPRPAGEEPTETRWAARFHAKLLEMAGVVPLETRPVTSEVGRVAARSEVRAELQAWLRTQFDENGTLIVNDARLAWFAPLWSEVAADVDAEVGLVMMLRHPLDCLPNPSENDDWQEKAIVFVAHWANLMLTLEHTTRDIRRTVVETQDLVGDWAYTIATSGADVGLAVLDSATTGQIRRANLAVGAHGREIDTVPRDWGGLHDVLTELAQQVWLDVRQLRADGDSAETYKQLDEDRVSYARLYRMIQGLAGPEIDRARRQGQHEGRHQERTERDQRVEEAPPSRILRAVPHGCRARVPVRWRKALLRLFTSERS